MTSYTWIYDAESGTLRTEIAANPMPHEVMIYGDMRVSDSLSVICFTTLDITSSGLVADIRRHIADELERIARELRNGDHKVKQ